MNLYQKLTAIEDKSSQLETRLGLPQRRNLLLRVASVVGQNRTFEDTLFVPRPYITVVPPSLVGVALGGRVTASNVQISESDLKVELSRRYPLDLFVRKDEKRITFILEPKVDAANKVVYSTNQKVEGIPCRFVGVFEDDPLIWTLVLRKEFDENKK